MEKNFYNEFKSSIESVNIDKLMEMSTSYDKKIEKLYKEAEKSVKNLFLKHMPMVNVGQFSNSCINVGNYVDDRFMGFEIYFREKNFFDPKDGYTMEVNTSAFGSFNAMEYNKYIGYFTAVADFLNNEELKNELFKIMEDFNNKYYEVRIKENIVQNKIKSIKREEEIKEKSEAAINRANLLKYNFENTDLSNKYVILVETVYDYDTIYRKKFYKSVFMSPMNYSNIYNEFSKNKARYSEAERNGKMVEASKVKFRTK